MDKTTILNSIDNWMQASSSNYGTYMIIMAVIIILGLAASVILYNRLGRSDERTDQTKLRINQLALGLGFVFTTVFIGQLNNRVEYISQLGLIPLALTIIAGGVVTAYYSLKER